MFTTIKPKSLTNKNKSLTKSLKGRAIPVLNHKKKRANALF